MKFFKDIDQRRWRGDSVWNREAEPVGLSGAVIGILSQDHHLDPVEWCMIECVKYQFSGWIYGKLFFLLHQERFEFTEIGGLELFPESFLPSLLDIWVNSRHATERYQKYRNPATYGRDGTVLVIFPA